MERTLEQMGQCAKQAVAFLAVAGTAEKDHALSKIAAALKAEATTILAANRQDLQQARENGMPQSLQDRLMLSTQRLDGMCRGIEELRQLPDPVGEVVNGSRRPNGLNIRKVRVPLGVAGIIYEARPNVTSDAACLCLKAGNAVILRGGKEALHANLAIVEAIRYGLEEADFPADCVQLIDDPSREVAAAMMRLNEYIDVLIPRGGAGLIQSVVKNATVPVIQTGVGNCHIYVDETADVNMAVNIVVNAKTSRPSVCNAAESLLIHKNAVDRVWPAIAKALTEKGVELRCCPRAAATAGVAVTPADEKDWGTEYLDLIMSVKVVDDIDEAIRHIARYGTGHSECIVTDSQKAAEQFTAAVDAAAVYVNASTRFTDGGEFGMGAEIGISTQKLHARGPMGLKELTSIKYIVVGNGQIR